MSLLHKDVRLHLQNLQWQRLMRESNQSHKKEPSTFQKKVITSMPNSAAPKEYDLLLCDGSWLSKMTTG